MRLHPRELLADDSVVVQLVDGSAEIDGATYARIKVKPRGMPLRKRFIQCTGKLRSGRRSDVIPAGVGFNR